MGELSFTAMFGQIWALPFLIFIYVVDINKIQKWTAWIVITLLLSYPSGEPSVIGSNTLTCSSPPHSSRLGFS